MNTSKYTSLIIRQSLILLIFSVVVTLVLSGCKTQSSSNKIRSIGAPGELLVVMDPALNSTLVNSTVVDFATQEFPCIPQPEPTFRLTTISPDHFERHFKSYRNILILKHNLLNSEQVNFETDVWASNQQIVEVKFSGKESFLKLFEDNRKQIFNHLYYGDIKTMSHANKKGADAATQRYIQKKYNIDITIPKGYRLVKDSLGFTWFRSDKLETIQSIIFHEFDLDSLESLNVNDLVRLRNYVTSRFVPGPDSFSFMTTEDRLPVQTRKLWNNELDIIEIRGLWKVEGYFMGGPFVNYFIKDQQTNKLIMVEGFVYAPKKQNKAYYVRQMESILQSLRLG